MGGVKPLSGINLDEDEWAMLTFNFTSVKEALAGKKDALKNVFTPPKDVSDMIKVYKAEWYLNGKLITNSESGREFYSNCFNFTRFIRYIKTNITNMRSHHS